MRAARLQQVLRKRAREQAWSLVGAPSSDRTAEREAATSPPMSPRHTPPTLGNPGVSLPFPVLHEPQKAPPVSVSSGFGDANPPF